MGLKGVAVSIAALAAAAAAVWSADGLPGSRQALPGHVGEQRAALMTHLGQVAARGLDPASLHTEAKELAKRAPLDPAPFLVTGAVDEQQRQASAALAMYQAALARDPRSRGAHFMLAGRALAGADADTALRHLASLARQSPGAGPEFAKLMVAVAADPALDPSLRRFLAREPTNRDTLFGAMAANPALTPRLMQLAPPSPRGPSPSWLPVMIQSELGARRIDQAALAWTRFGGGADPRRETVRDGQFRMAGPGAPFGWTLIDSDEGAAAANLPGLDIESYGRAAQPLLSQWLLLRPGRYRLRSDLRGQVARQVEWRVQCLAPLARTQARAAVGRPSLVNIPADCPAQSLELWTLASENVEQASGKLLSVRLERLP